MTFTKWFIPLLLMMGSVAKAQTTCSTSSPCESLQINTGTPNFTGTVQLYRCIGASAQCSLAALQSLIATPGPSVWQAAPVATKSTVVPSGILDYNDAVQYGALMNYAVSVTVSGEVAGPLSAIFQTTIPPAPSPTPVIAQGQAPPITSGTVGLQ